MPNIIINIKLIKATFNMLKITSFKNIHWKSDRKLYINNLKYNRIIFGGIIELISN